MHWTLERSGASLGSGMLQRRWSAGWLQHLHARSMGSSVSCIPSGKGLIGWGLFHSRWAGSSTIALDILVARQAEDSPEPCVTKHLIRPSRLTAAVEPPKCTAAAADNREECTQHPRRHHTIHLFRGSSTHKRKHTNNEVSRKHMQTHRIDYVCDPSTGEAPHPHTQRRMRAWHHSRCRSASSGPRAVRSVVAACACMALVSRSGLQRDLGCPGDG